MKPEDLKQSPPNVTPCPFSGGEKQPAQDSLEPPAKRRAVSEQADSKLPESAVSALLSGDSAAYESADWRQWQARAAAREWIQGGSTRAPLVAGSAGSGSGSTRAPLVAGSAGS